MALRHAAARRLAAWAAARHGRDLLPVTIDRRRVYILPTRFGLMLALLVFAMGVAGLNYNSNLELGFGFLLGSAALVTMHHCNRNLLRLIVDADTAADAFAHGSAWVEFALQNDANVHRGDIEVRVGSASVVASVPARSAATLKISIAAAGRGILRIPQIELRTGYPFGWFSAWTYVQSPLTIYVAPTPRGAQLPPAGLPQGSTDRSAARGDEDFAGLRAYLPGMPLKHMAWKVLARGGEPVIRSYTGTAAQPEWLDWSALEGSDVETRLSQLCQWVLNCEASGASYGLRLPGLQIAPAAGAAHRSACLRALASYGQPTA